MTTKQHNIVKIVLVWLPIAMAAATAVSWCFCVVKDISQLKAESVMRERWWSDIEARRDKQTEKICTDVEQVKEVVLRIDATLNAYKDKAKVAMNNQKQEVSQ